MKNALQVYLKRCKEDFSQYGFIKDKSTFARVVNDVLQTFTFKRYSSGRECTVEFGIFPLCMRLPWPGVGIYDLAKFDLETYHGWIYDRNSESDIARCVDSIVDTIHRELIPLFERSKSCADAPYELLEVDRIFEQNRLEVLRRGNSENKAKPFETRCYGMPDKLYMALKARDLPLAEKCLTTQLENSKSIYFGQLSMLENIDDKLRDALLKNIENHRERIALLSDWLDQLRSGDFSKITPVLLENEIYSQKALEKFICK